MLTPEQEKYLVKRTALQKIWPWAAGLLVLIWVGGMAAFFLRLPLLANPFLMIERLESGGVPSSSLVVYAAMVPLLFHFIGFLMAVLILFMVDRMLGEKKLLEIVRRLREGQGAH
jgi:hypothetical protein